MCALWMQLSLSPLNPHLYSKFPTASPPSGSFLYLTRVGHGVRLAGNLGLTVLLGVSDRFSRPVFR